MRKIEQLAYGASALALVLLSSAEAFAGQISNSHLPAPGVIGLVAGGVIAAIAVARLRK